MKLRYWLDFNKRQNSTKRPDLNQGTEINVYLKDNTSLDNPVFIVSGELRTWSYCYAPSLSRYYFITDIVSISRDQFEVHCVMDAAATYRPEILAYTAFVERAASQYDPMVNDNLLSMQQLIESNDTTSTSLSSFFGSGCYIVEALAKNNGIVLYVTDTLEPYKHILSPGVYTTNDKNEWITSQIAQAFDLDKYLGGVKWIPFDSSDLGSATNDFFIGPVNIGMFNDYTIIKASWFTKQTSINLSLPGPLYGDFRDCNPRFTQYSAMLCGVGLVSLDPSIIGYAILNGLTVTVDLLIDLVSGEISYHFRIGTKYFARFSGNISVDVPIGKALVDTVKSAKMLGGSVAAGAAAGGAIGAAAGAVVGAVEAIYNSMVPDVSMLGGAGNRVEISGTDGYITLVRRQYGAKDYPTSVAGRPLCQNVRLGELSGFVKCGNASVPLIALDHTRTEINNMLNSGIYIE